MMFKYLRGLLLVIAAAGLALGGVGCIFSPDDGGDPVPTPGSEYEFPDDMDKCMGNFEKAYTDMEFDPFDNKIFGDGILHDDYRFFQDIPGSQMDDWTYADEVIFLNNLFLGAPFVNAQGVSVAQVNSITLTLDGSAGTWVPSDDQRFPGPDCWKRTYSVVFDVGQPGLTLQVRNDNTFFVKRKPVEHEGETTWYYQICGQVELPTAK